MVTLDFTKQLTLYIDARRVIMLQRSGGLKNLKDTEVFYPVRGTQISLLKYHSSCAFFSLKIASVYMKAFLFCKKVGALPHK